MPVNAQVKSLSFNSYSVSGSIGLFHCSLVFKVGTTTLGSLETDNTGQYAWYSGSSVSNAGNLIVTTTNDDYLGTIGEITLTTDTGDSLTVHLDVIYDGETAYVDSQGILYEDSSLTTEWDNGQSIWSNNGGYLNNVQVGTITSAVDSPLVGITDGVSLTSGDEEPSPTEVSYIELIASLIDYGISEVVSQAIVSALSYGFSKEEIQTIVSAITYGYSFEQAISLVSLEEFPSSLEILYSVLLGSLINYGITENVIVEVNSLFGAGFQLQNLITISENYQAPSTSEDETVTINEDYVGSDDTVYFDELFSIGQDFAFIQDMQSVGIVHEVNIGNSYGGYNVRRR